MKIREILHGKGYHVVTITEERTVSEAVRILVKHNIGSLLVVNGEDPVGILTERDVLRCTEKAAERLESLSVGSVMTRELITASPEDELHEAMSVMTRRRVRHLPVFEGARVAGILSIGDLLNACRMVAEQENALLREYIQGTGTVR